MQSITAAGLTKRFGDVTAVDSLDLSIEAGTVYGFLGPNGAGKTTTMRMLTTLTRPTSGTAEIVGVPITDRPRVIEHVGYLPETPPVFDELTGREQLEHVAGLRDLPPGVATERIESLLERFSLVEAADDRIASYSKGMKQKVGLAQALVHEPEVLFLDEPTSGLDPRATRTVLDLVGTRAATGQTVFLSTHVLPVVEEIADVVGVLSDGELVAEGPPAELTAATEAGHERTLEEVFLEVTTEFDVPPGHEVA